MIKSFSSPFTRAIAAGFTLAFIAALCVFFILHAQHNTSEKISANQNARMMQVINDLLPAETLTEDTITVCKLFSHKKIGKNMPFLTVTDKNNKPLGYIATFSTSRGYSNPLILIAGLTSDLKIYKVDIQASKETPGIGDKVDRNHGNFLDQFDNQNLESIHWEVKKFGGDFDYITGATVTSRAIVLASRDLLKAVNETDLSSLPLCKGALQ
ncbi:RnfABCDGE type electron transport complex subunit G [Succinatimonas hippei]|uniref:Electron transport complex, RnfABCDGE type, G subunit n=1 Tax=Succinatimonas hippei (strain DSM 22608 / JCM 16073 / KCTC 15190 / YIT 12066) TaxID=762983 RepID=E8LMV5_SUCHY|nr:RnfABCDGE type electron transport complex subunit G [Succinatimonas hippei]EFY06131.1 electron transport complex, RnfABCDGE type, G subunit [Succinatimonas hippei YIT 12066]MCL1602430.1 RnfABCDGE type electron transport complex subunit G [Succinatimonas hippei]